jgi:hypothetical protein
MDLDRHLIEENFTLKPALPAGKVRYEFADLDGVWIHRKFHAAGITH